jgi:glucose-6-phosphate-specific signal transduction histidine kinase
MPEHRDMPVTNEQFDKTVQQLAKVLIASNESIRLALERNMRAILTQTIELVKAQAGHHNPTTTVEAIVKSVKTTFDDLG